MLNPHTEQIRHDALDRYEAQIISVKDLETIWALTDRIVKVGKPELKEAA